MTQIKQMAPKKVKVMLIGNKSDLEEERVVTYEQGQKVAQKYGILFEETSALNA